MVRRLLTEDRDRVAKLRAAPNRRSRLSKQKEAEHLEGTFTACAQRKRKRTGTRRADSESERSARCRETR